VKRAAAALAAALVLAAGLWFLLAWRGHAPAELAELAGEGGAKLLREPMRPARGGTRVLVFALDGVGDGELQAALAGGAMPRTASLLGPREDERTWAHAWAAPGVLSVLPSTTYAAWVSLFTGRPPAQTGVPGNEWFVREEMRFYAPAPVSVSEGEHAVRTFTDGLLDRAIRVPTVYERADVRAYAALQPVHRGADLLVLPVPSAYARMAVRMAGGIADGGPLAQEAFEELDERGAESLLEAIREHGVADLQVVYFPGVDLYTHVAEDPLPDQLRYLREVIDRAVGEVLDAYAGAGALHDTWVVFVSDHGHTPVLADPRHALATDTLRDPPAVLRRAGFRLRPFELEPDARDYQSALAYQGAFAYVYLADRSTCPRPGDVCDWARPPRLEEDVIPAARAFHAAARTGAGVPELRGAVDLVFARPPRAVGEDALPFQVWDGERLVPVGEYLAAHPRPELLELERRLEGLAAGPYGHRAGDVLLLARSGLEVPIDQRFYFAAEYTSWHGSPTRQDSEIPLLVAHPGRSGAQVRERVRRAVGERPDQLSVASLLLELLGTAGDPR
jgi:hypothetical protein